MADQRLAQLVSVLSKRTTDRKIAWEKTVEEGVYQAAFSGYSVHIFSRSGQRGTDYVVQLYNEAGELIEEVSDVDLDGSHTGQYFEMMKDMYADARRSVMGVDKAIDAILEELEAP